ncbi:MAG: sigma-70 region 4 domain-containing protein, partial [Lachnospiraceae bacterium]|nr:sigma-70 region 4 domain-containing protein [Lachnospiraceae bacterium]
DGLPEDQRKCIIAFYYDECKVKDIAAAFNVPEGTVKTNLYQGRKRIERGLNDYAKKHGVKVLTVAVIPFLSMAFTQKVSACSLSLSFSAVAGAALSASAVQSAGGAFTTGSGMTAGAPGAAAVAKVGAATASKVLATKIAIAVAAVAVVGGGSALAYSQAVKPAATGAPSSVVASAAPSSAVASAAPSSVASSAAPSSEAASKEPTSEAAVDVVKAQVKDGTYLAFARNINKLTLENGVFEIEFTGVENNMSTYRSQLYNPVSGERKIKIRCSEDKTIYGDMDYIYPEVTGTGHLETLAALQQKIAAETKQYREYGEDAEVWHDTGYFFEIKDGCLTKIFYWNE